MLSEEFTTSKTSSQPEKLVIDSPFLASGLTIYGASCRYIWEQIRIDIWEPIYKAFWIGSNE